MPKILLLNIGNTNTVLAELRAGLPHDLVRFSTSEWFGAPDRLSILNELPDARCLAACVVPEVATELMKRHGPERIRFLEAGMVPEIDFSVVDVRTIGADRLANARAALLTHRPPLVVLDCGTAITTEVLDAEGRFRGGAIMLGRRLMRKALHENTGLLPEVAMQQGAPEAVGTDTPSAICGGVDVGAIGAVQRILEQTGQELGVPGCSVIATGGDAAFFMDAITGLTPAPADFTLRGLAAVAERLFEDC